MKITRREFVVASGIFALAAGRTAGTANQSVVVLGAGLAGLSAAYQLAQKGYKVTVVEARGRLGGRVFTLRDPFSNGLFTETGGELIGDEYKRFIGYLDEFGIEYSELQPEAETGGSVAEIQDGIGRNAYMKGNFYRKGDVILNHPYGLTGEEGRMLPPTLLGKFLRLMNNDLRQGKTSLAELDRVSLAGALRSRGVSKKAIKLIDISLNYNSIYTVSAGAVLSDGSRRRNAGTVPLKVHGGNDNLISALGNAASKAGAEIILGSPVTRIHQSDGKVAVWYSDRKRSKKMIEADKVVCTIPFSVLRGIPIYPEFEGGKKRAIKELDYTRITKVYLQAKYSEWDKRALGSSIWTDTPIERIFSTTGKTGDERGLFTIWTEGRGSKRLEKLSSRKRMDYAVSQFEDILPFMKGNVEKTETLSWSLDPYSQGGYSHLKVGQLSAIQPHIAAAVGRIHFAGEHTASEMPGMEGALESAERVVNEITG